VSSEVWAKEDWSFGGLRRNIGAAGSCPWGSTGKSRYAVDEFEKRDFTPLSVTRNTRQNDSRSDHIRVLLPDSNVLRKDGNARTSSLF